MRVKIHIDDEVTPDLLRIISELEVRTPMHEAAGRAVEVVLRRHFRERNQERNKMGWKNSSFGRALDGRPL